MPGGNSHQRAKERATKARKQKQPPEPVKTTTILPTVGKLSDSPKEGHLRDYLLAAGGLLSEFLAVKYSASWLAWSAAFLFWLAAYDYTKLKTSKLLRSAVPICAAIVLIIATMAITGVLPSWSQFVGIKHKQTPGAQIIVDWEMIASLPIPTEFPVVTLSPVPQPLAKRSKLTKSASKPMCPDSGYAAFTEVVALKSLKDKWVFEKQRIDADRNNSPYFTKLRYWRLGFRSDYNKEEEKALKIRDAILANWPHNPLPRDDYDSVAAPEDIERVVQNLEFLGKLCVEGRP